MQQEHDEAEEQKRRMEQDEEDLKETQLQHGEWSFSMLREPCHAKEEC